MDYVDSFNNVTLLFDFNNLAIRMFFGSAVEDPSNPNWGLWKYNVFSSIYQSMRKIANVNEVVLAVDDHTSWRKAVYKRYKESRKGKKEDSKVDWTELHGHMYDFLKELKHHMPFKVLRVKSAEADDIIAVLVKDIKTPCIIVSGDEDFKQLLRRDNVLIYDPYNNKFISNKEVNAKEFLLEKIFCGQKKDDIPNIMTPDDWGLTEETKDKRRPGFGPAKFKKISPDIKGFIESKQEIKGYGEVNVKKNLVRNRMMMDFDKIPNTIINRICDSYCNNHTYPPPENMIVFFEKNQMRSFLDDIHRVDSKLSRLYG